MHDAPPDLPREADLGRCATTAALHGYGDPWSLHDLGFEEDALWLKSGEEAARERLSKFIPRMSRYTEDRNHLQRTGTSGLSAHLRFGTISIRECVRAVRTHPSPGADSWLSELIWREFYQSILDGFPFVVNQTFHEQYDAIVWPGTDAHFDAWRNGRTGYPIVDAAPYFRIFSPVLQSRKFDPDGANIRTWIPELRGFDNRRIHWPVESHITQQRTARCIIGEDYPSPIVDHAEQREKAVALFAITRPVSGASGCRATC